MRGLSFFVLFFFYNLSVLAHSLPSSAICTLGFDSAADFKPEDVNYSDLVAEAPVDGMGLKFYMSFGHYAKTSDLLDPGFDDYVVDLFKLRLDLAREYGTFFYNQMTTKVDGLPKWQARWEGKYEEGFHSFGIRGHGRIHEIWEFYQDHFNYEGRTTQVETSTLPLWDGPLISEALEVKFENPLVDGMDFYTYIMPNGTYYMRHASGSDMPAAREKLKELYYKFQDPRLSREERLTALLEFEWLWFWTNPFGRAGASIGSTISVKAEVMLAQEGFPIQLREEFYFQDLYALSNKLQDYINFRIQQLMPGLTDH